jgi:hypothetical protein
VGQSKRTARKKPCAVVSGDKCHISIGRCGFVPCRETYRKNLIGPLPPKPRHSQCLLP